MSFPRQESCVCLRKKNVSRQLIKTNIELSLKDTELSLWGANVGLCHLNICIKWLCIVFKESLMVSCCTVCSCHTHSGLTWLFVLHRWTPDVPLHLAQMLLNSWIWSKWMYLPGSWSGEAAAVRRGSVSRPMDPAGREEEEKKSGGQELTSINSPLRVIVWVYALVWATPRCVQIWHEPAPETQSYVFAGL